MFMCVNVCVCVCVTEAGRSLKAIEAAIQCRQFSKATGIIDYLDHSQALPYYKRIAAHYESTGNLDEVRVCACVCMRVTFVLVLCAIYVHPLRGST